MTALRWYAEHVGLAAGTLRCVGNKWHHRGESPQLWIGDDGDEQPLDAAAITEALVDAWQHTGDATLARMAGWAFGWFLGRNRTGVAALCRGDRRVPGRSVRYCAKWEPGGRVHASLLPSVA